MPVNNNDDFTLHQRELLARLDERTRAIQQMLDSTRNDLKNMIIDLERKVESKFSSIEQSFRDHELEDEKRFETVDKKLTDYVKKEGFTPVQRLVYGFVGMIVIAVVGALISTVIQK